jgi:hypothetical protein
MDRDDGAITSRRTKAKVHSMVQIETVSCAPPTPHQSAGFNPPQCRIVLPLLTNLRPMPTQGAPLHIANELQVFLQVKKSLKQMVRMPSDSSTIPHERIGVNPDLHSSSLRRSVFGVRRSRFEVQGQDITDDFVSFGLHSNL